MKFLLPASLALALMACHDKQVPKFDTNAADMKLPQALSMDSLSTSQFHGKVRLVSFWASWCQPCMQEQPMLKELQRDLATQGFQVVSVNLDTDRDEEFTALVKEMDLNFPVLLGGETEVAAYGNFSSLPTGFIVDRNGQIREQIVGLLPHGELRAKILRALQAPVNGTVADSVR